MSMAGIHAIATHRYRYLDFTKSSLCLYTAAGTGQPGTIQYHQEKLSGAQLPAQNEQHGGAFGVSLLTIPTAKHAQLPGG